MAWEGLRLVRFISTVVRRREMQIVRSCQPVPCISSQAVRDDQKDSWSARAVCRRGGAVLNCPVRRRGSLLR